MSYPLSLAASATGLAAALVLACSDTSDPSEPSLVPSDAAAAVPTLTPQQSGTTNRLQAVSPVNANVVWASGVGGTFTVTTNGGHTWRAGVVPGGDSLQFRDVEGVSADLLVARPGNDANSIAWLVWHAHRVQGAGRKFLKELEQLAVHFTGGQVAGSRGRHTFRRHGPAR